MLPAATMAFPPRPPAPPTRLSLPQQSPLTHHGLPPPPPPSGSLVAQLPLPPPPPQLPLARSFSVHVPPSACLTSSAHASPTGRWHVKDQFLPPPPPIPPSPIPPPPASCRAPVALSVSREADFGHSHVGGHADYVKHSDTIMRSLAPLFPLGGVASEDALANSAAKFCSTMCELTSDGVVSAWVSKLLKCVLDSCISPESSATNVMFPDCVVKLVSTHCQTKHILWSRPEHLRVAEPRGPTIPEERRMAINSELNRLMIHRCMPLLEPKNVRFSTVLGAKPVFLAPPERRFFFMLKGVIDLECSMEPINAKLDIILPAIPPAVLRPDPVCPTPGVFPPVPIHSGEITKPRRFKKRRAAQA